MRLLLKFILKRRKVGKETTFTDEHDKEILGLTKRVLRFGKRHKITTFTDEELHEGMMTLAILCLGLLLMLGSYNTTDGHQMQNA